MHLIGHHVRVNLHQAFVFGKSVEKENGEREKRIFYSQIGVMLQYFDHCCSPNVYAIDHDGDTYYYAVRPIKTGDELTISYYCFHWDPVLALEWYRKFSKFKCNCERCKFQKPTADEVNEFKTNPHYGIVYGSNIQSEIEQIDKVKYDTLMESCIILLKKFDRILWCYPLSVVITVYITLLTANLRGIVQDTPDQLNNNN